MEAVPGKHAQNARVRVREPDGCDDMSMSRIWGDAREGASLRNKLGRKLDDFEELDADAQRQELLHVSVLRH